ncbi:MAG: copper chaperone PCu(A)C [Pseudomonadota bacterium]
MLSVKTILTAAGVSLLTLPALAGAIVVDDPYARAASPNAKSGAAFMVLTNTGSEDDHLVSASSDISARVELHTHKMDGDVMRMIHVEEGFVLPAGQSIALERGGKHVMFMGLNAALEQGNVVEVTLTFEKAGDIVVQIPVDLERAPKGHGHDHGHSHGHGDHDHSPPTN